MSIILVCGDRDWTDRKYIYDVLDYTVASFARNGDPVEKLIEGEAVGADEFAGDWAEERGVSILTRKPWIPVRPYRLYSKAINEGRERGFPALWDKNGRSAGPRRNQEMFDVGQPVSILAFHNDIENSIGTKHMISIAQKAGVKYLVLAPDKLIQQADR